METFVSFVPVHLQYLSKSRDWKDKDLSSILLKIEAKNLQNEFEKS